MCAALCGVGQPADLFDSGASGSLPRDTSGLFSEGPLMVAPGKRGGQVWRETEISLATTCRHPSNYPQSTQLHYMFSCCFLLLNMAENTKLRVVLLFWVFSDFLSSWISGSPPQKTRGGRVRCGHRGIWGGRWWKTQDSSSCKENFLKCYFVYEFTSAVCSYTTCYKLHLHNDASNNIIMTWSFPILYKHF